MSDNLIGKFTAITLEDADGDTPEPYSKIKLAEQDAQLAANITKNTYLVIKIVRVIKPKQQEQDEEEQEQE